MDYAPGFNISHDLAFEFADHFKTLAPEGFDHVFYTGSGWESVDTALNIALAYHRARKAVITGLALAASSTTAATLAGC